MASRTCTYMQYITDFFPNAPPTANCLALLCTVLYFLVFALWLILPHTPGDMCADHRVHTEWQWSLSSVHSIMMEKSAQPGEGGGALPPPFTISTITYKVVVYAPAEKADTLILFLLNSYTYSVVQTLYVSS